MENANKKDVTSDEMDKMLTEYYKKSSSQIPNSTLEVIETALLKEKLPMRKDFSIIYQIITIITSLIFLGTSVAYAKNPYNSLTFWFNTEDVVSKAIENGYNQNIDMNYIYSNNVGIKADLLLISDTVLSIDFKYNYNLEKVAEILINEMTIENENNDILYSYKSEKEEDLEIFTEKVKRAYSYPNENEENIQFFSSDFAEANSLNIKITSIKVKKDNEYKIVNGNWNLNVDLNSNMIERNKEYYYATYEDYQDSKQYSKYIKQVDAELNETTMKIKIELNKKIEEDILLKRDSIILSNFNTLESYNRVYCNVENNDTESIVEVEFDLSLFDENIDNLEFSMLINRTDSISINLNK